MASLRNKVRNKVQVRKGLIVGVVSCGWAGRGPGAVVVCTGFAGRATRRLAKASAESRTGQTTVEAMVVVLQCWGGRTQVGANSQARLARGQRAVAGRGHGLRWLQTGQFGWIKLGRHGSSSPSGLRCPLRVLRGGQGVQRRSPADRHSVVASGQASAVGLKS